MKVKLLSQAKKDLLDIFEYYNRKQDTFYAITIYNDLLNEIELLGILKAVINTASIYTSKRGYIYYSHLVSKRKNYKFIYTQNNNVIYVFFIWDCRRNPKALKELLERE